MKFVNQTISSQLEGWAEMLLQGDLYSYEQGLFSCMNGIYDFISEELLPSVSCQVIDKLVEQGRASGGRKIEVR
ncbi:MAG: hypothetical protein KDE33_14120, partial [Bacteroidetes bacterium]|nr:hypothetical protein [Bacteroidota bacterium]